VSIRQVSHIDPHKSQCHSGAGQISNVGPATESKRSSTLRHPVAHKFRVMYYYYDRVRVRKFERGRGEFRLNRPTNRCRDVLEGWGRLYRPIKITLVRRHSKNDNTLSSELGWVVSRRCAVVAATRPKCVKYTLHHAQENTI